MRHFQYEQARSDPAAFAAAAEMLIEAFTAPHPSLLMLLMTGSALEQERDKVTPFKHPTAHALRVGLASDIGADTALHEQGNCVHDYCRIVVFLHAFRHGSVCLNFSPVLDKITMDHDLHRRTHHGWPMGPLQLALALLTRSHQRERADQHAWMACGMCFSMPRSCSILSMMC